jgi:hypothetical protein
MDEDASGPSQGLSAAKAARILGVRESTVAKWVSEGVPPKAVKWQRYSLDWDDVADVEGVGLRLSDQRRLQFQSTADRQAQQRRESHDARATDLDQCHDYHLTECRPVGGGVDGREPGDAVRGDAREHRRRHGPRCGRHLSACLFVCEPRLTAMTIRMGGPDATSLSWDEVGGPRRRHRGPHLTPAAGGPHAPMCRPLRRPVRPGAVSLVCVRSERRAGVRRPPVGDDVAVTHPDVAEPDPFRGGSGSDEVGVAEAFAVTDTVARHQHS